MALTVEAEQHEKPAEGDRARCPITGAPASRLIQTVSSSLLTGLWKYNALTDVADLFAGIDEIELWESPCGLAFFTPAVAGDDKFYKSLYNRFKAHEKLAQFAAERPEFLAAARHVREGDKVLDVGSGSAGLRMHVEHAHFTGLDPYAETEDIAPGIVREHAHEHADKHAESYDVVTAFQVLEHTVDPVAFSEDLLRLLKPGGKLVYGVPLWPSKVTQSPNVLINCPPHHLTWWNESSLAALADVLGLEVVENIELPSPGYLAYLHWMAKLTWVDMGDLFYANRASWHFNVAIGLPIALLCDRFFGLPANAPPVDVMLVARKPG